MIVGALKGTSTKKLGKERGLPDFNVMGLCTLTGLLIQQLMPYAVAFYPPRTQARNLPMRRHKATILIGLLTYAPFQPLHVGRMLILPKASCMHAPTQEQSCQLMDGQFIDLHHSKR